jgi:hypothetical protein
MQAFTSVSLNYLPKARVLAETLKRQHPEARFHLVLADRLPQWLAAAPGPFDSITQVEQMPVDNVKGWIFQHSLVELCTAVKGEACRMLSRRYPNEPLFYFDPDIVVLGRLDPLLAELARTDILLTPHLLEPEDSLEAVLDNEVCALKHGVYNLGFLGLAPTAEGRRFIDWWAKRLNTLCYNEVERGLFTDQRWIDLAPAFFPTVGIVRDPGCNVATWNLSRRKITGSLDQGLQANGRPLLFFHFSGFDSGAQKIMLDKFGGDSPVLYQLRNWYVQECQRNGQDKFGRQSWSYGFFDNGAPITDEHRRIYRDRIDLQELFPEPAATGDAKHSFYHWFRQEMAPPEILHSRDRLWKEFIKVRTELARIRNSRSYQTVVRASQLIRGTWLHRRAA